MKNCSMSFLVLRRYHNQVNELEIRRTFCGDLGLYAPKSRMVHHLAPHFPLEHPVHFLFSSRLSTAEPRSYST